MASVTDMGFMFAFASNFNQPIDDWDVASVTDMEYMFYKASNFNQCLSLWASKAPTDVSVVNLFEDNGCPNNADPDPSVSPWCHDKLLIGDN